MEDIKSDSKTYYPWIVFFLLFGTTFFFGSISSILDPNGIITVNGVEQLATFGNSWPMLLIGAFTLFLALNYWLTYHKAEINGDKITVMLFGKKREYDLNQLDSAEVKFAFNMHLSLIKITTNDGRTYKLHSDSIIDHLPNFFSEYPAYQSEMWKRIEKAYNKV